MEKKVILLIPTAKILLRKKMKPMKRVEKRNLLKNKTKSAAPLPCAGAAVCSVG